jgi:hypothetical protein
MRSTVLAIVVCVVVSVAACGGGGGSIPDADPNAPLCTGAVYDNCTGNTGCMSMNCHVYSQSAIQVCTQSCSSSNPCPNDATGAPGQCNNMGICKPAKANACRPN